jgi:hypothetical protein
MEVREIYVIENDMALRLWRNIVTDWLKAFLGNGLGEPVLGFTALGYEYTRRYARVQCGLPRQVLASTRLATLPWYSQNS